MGDDGTKAPTGDDLDGKISTCKIRVLRAARNFAKVMAEFDGHLEFCSERMNEVLDAADHLIEMETAASTNGAAPGAGDREMNQAHRERVCRLLSESGMPAGIATQTLFISAYNAVLAKDLLWVMTELLQYKQAEIHR